MDDWTLVDHVPELTVNVDHNNIDEWSCVSISSVRSFDSCDNLAEAKNRDQSLSFADVVKSNPVYERKKIKTTPYIISKKKKRKKKIKPKLAQDEYTEYDLNLQRKSKPKRFRKTLRHKKHGKH